MIRSFIPFTEKERKKKWNWVGSVFPEADPRILIRIHIKMKRIRNTELNTFPANQRPCKALTAATAQLMLGHFT